MDWRSVAVPLSSILPNRIGLTLLSRLPSDGPTIFVFDDNLESLVREKLVDELPGRWLPVRKS